MPEYYPWKRTEVRVSPEETNVVYRRQETSSANSGGGTPQTTKITIPVNREIQKVVGKGDSIAEAERNAQKKIEQITDFYATDD